VIVISLLLIGVAAVMLVLGLWQPSNALLSGSIGASVLAAVLLVVGVRRSSGAPDLDDIDPEAGADADVDRLEAYVRPADAPVRQPIEVPDDATASIPQQGPPAGNGSGPEDELDPPDEPAAQRVSEADAAKVSGLATEVLVVDGRPRYHLPGCVHLLGRDSEPLPVSEAVELGFTPCGLCEPDSALLASARRV
jgi:hypothetical protein